MRERFKRDAFMYQKSRVFHLLFLCLFLIADMHCGCVAVLNPILAVLGDTTTRLAAVGYNVYERYSEKHKNNADFYLVEMPDDVLLAERFYYEHRKEVLEKTQQELMGIKNNLQVIKGLPSGSFTCQFLQKYVYCPVENTQQLSVIKEKRLSDKQKNILRDARENELAALEKQIRQIQFLLMLHAAQLIENVQIAEASYDSAATEIGEAIAVWNDNCRAMPYDVALKVYKYDLLQEHLVHAIGQAFEELCIVSEYYRICMNQGIESCALIIAALDQIVPVINEKKQWLAEQEKCAWNNSAIAEQHFAQHNISVAVFKNEAKKEFDKQQKKRAAEVLKKIEMQQLANSGFGGGPKKDDDEEEKVEISEQDKDHIFRDSEGHFTQDTPQARKIIEDIVADKNNYNGLDKYGTKWYSKITLEGEQLWAGVRDGKIRYAGVNNVPWPKDMMTGLLIRPACVFKT